MKWKLQYNFMDQNDDNPSNSITEYFASEEAAIKGIMKIYIDWYNKQSFNGLSLHLDDFEDFDSFNKFADSFNTFVGENELTRSIPQFFYCLCDVDDLEGIVEKKFVYVLHFRFADKKNKNDFFDTATRLYSTEEAAKQGAIKGYVDWYNDRHPNNSISFDSFNEFKDYIQAENDKSVEPVYRYSISQCFYY